MSTIRRQVRPVRPAEADFPQVFMEKPFAFDKFWRGRTYRLGRLTHDKFNHRASVRCRAIAELSGGGPKAGATRLPHAAH